METAKVVPTEKELEHFELGNPDIIELIRQAQESDAADRQLTLWTAIKKYKKAVAWSCLLSAALVMEGYDVVIVRCAILFFLCSSQTLIRTTDQRVFRPVLIPGKVRRCRCGWREVHHSPMAIRTCEFGFGWTVVWPCCQYLGTGPLW